MITIEALVNTMRESREEKLALTVVVGLMTNSLDESVARLESILPQLEGMKNDSRKGRGKKPRLDINHDLARKIYDIADEILPWLKKVAEVSREPEDEIQGLA